MNIISIYYGHNATVGLTVDGELIFLGSEERISREKNYVGFPSKTLKYVIDEYLSGNIDSCDKFVISDKYGHGVNFNKYNVAGRKFNDYFYKRKGSYWLEQITKSLNFKKYIEDSKSKESSEDFSNLIDAYLQQFGISMSKVINLDHHLCHAATPLFFMDQLDQGLLIFTCDGEGDNISSTVNIYHGGVLKRISENSKEASIGQLYRLTTAYLGMKHTEHEFKVMGLAPYADPLQVDRLAGELKKLLILEDGKFRHCYGPLNQCMPILLRLYAFERFDVICGALQKITEDLISAWISYWVEHTQVRRVALSGGVFMNVKLNKKIGYLPNIDSVFCTPSCGDESIPIGSLFLANSMNQILCKPIKHLYLGRKFSNDVEQLVQEKFPENDFFIKRFNDTGQCNMEIAKHLASNRVVGRYRGREEWGARALGNRSILCNPADYKNVEKINSQIKCRDFWMPFAATILDENKSDYLDYNNKYESPFMSSTYSINLKYFNELAAAVHPRDKTMRPQILKKDVNPEYYDLISKFKMLTGIGAVLNTSFNLHGDPNVSSPEDAVNCFLNSGLEILNLNDYIIEKR